MANYGGLNLNFEAVVGDDDYVPAWVDPGDGFVHTEEERAAYLERLKASGMWTDEQAEALAKLY